MTPTEKNKMVDYIIIAVLMLLLSVIFVALANAQELGFRVVVDHTNLNSSTQVLKTSNPVLVEKNYNHYFNDSIDIKKFVNRHNYFIEIRTEKVIWYCELNYIDKNGNYKHLNKKRVKQLINKKK